MQRGKIAGARIAALLAALASGLWLVLAVTARAQEAPPLTVDLEYQETTNVLANQWLYTGTGAPLPIVKKQPASQGTLQIYCLAVGADQISAALDQTGGRLYVDLNQNGDLTDDPEGIYTTTKLGGQLFTNVAIHVPTGGGLWRCRFDISFLNYRMPNVQVRSFYQGRLTWSGKDWQVGIIKVPDQKPGSDWSAGGQLLLRPWPDRAKPIRLNDGIPEAIPLPRQLFFQGAQFQVKGPVYEASRWRLKLVPQPASKLGELIIQGSHVHRLILDRSPELAVVLDDPQSPVKIPVGSYPQQKGWVHLGGSDAVFKEIYQPQPALIIRETEAAVVAAGGPLSNSVQVTTRGTRLQMNYQLVGAGKREFTLPGQDRSQPPQFTVYQGDRKVHSGKFEFG